MNLKLKTLAAVVAMTVAGAANAAIYTDNYNGFNGITTGTGDGELFLSILDPSVNQSLVLDLNLTVNQFRYTNASLINTFSVTDATLAGFIAASPVPFFTPMPRCAPTPPCCIISTPIA